MDDRKIEQLKGNKALGDERANNGKALGSGVNAARAGMTQAELEAEYDEVFGFHVFKIGDRVSKNSGDYVFSGTVVAIFKKRSGVVRYVVEDERGLLLIMNEQQLKAPTGDGT